MIREPYHEDIVKEVLLSSKFRTLCIKELFKSIEHFQTISRKYSYLESKFDNKHNDKPNVRNLRIPIYSLHLIADEISYRSGIKPTHENALDSVVYCCLRLVLAPFIKRGIVYSLHRGYHYFLISYNSLKFNDTIIDNLQDLDYDINFLNQCLESQLEERDEETKELIKILNELHE